MDISFYQCSSIVWSQAAQTLFVIYIRDSIALHFEPFKRILRRYSLTWLYGYVRPQRVWFFRAVLVVNRVSISANFGHFGHK